MVREEEVWKLKKFIENEQNADARSFSRAKGKVHEKLCEATYS